ncbi:peptidase S8 [Paenibacillus oralis]|uniref:Peptidase S8 n=1 Tax=Paenibacillus oralis TaxID=2490856 RepID=A0A3P3U3U6_9BACL|nr:S8 family serine peptidase [Paenibacillus oralis]RRJ64991.1 peptidase S8 [Paenibacillus oralis]
MKIVKFFSINLLAILLIALPVTASAQEDIWASVDNGNSVVKPMANSKIKIIDRQVEDNNSIQHLSIDLSSVGQEKLSGASKVLEALQQKINQHKLSSAQDKIEVSIMLKYDASITKDEFIKNHEELFEGAITNPDGFGVFSFFAALTPEQIETVIQLDEVSSVSTPDDVVSVYGEPVEDQEGVYLNGSTEMTGIKKARSDYGVTGNRDGKASYSKNDSVIAIIDTGIDGDHVDLNGGKILGWMDFVNGRTTPYDDLGHGTHVASIAAGIGAGDPGIQTGVAPGAALVGVKVCVTDTNCSTQNVLNALDWIIANKSNYGIDVINISLGSAGNVNTNICNRVNSAIAKGILTVVAAGNTPSGADYGSLNHIAKCSNVVSVGNMADPYEGGWYLNFTSNRGTGSQGPSLTAPGTLIRAAKANSTNEYIAYSGTSMASPMIAGLAALMLHASNGDLSYDFSTEGFGMSGYDKVYGNGLILGHDTIKAAKGSSSGSYDDYRDHIRAQSGIDASTMDMYSIKVNSTDAYFASTLIIDDENGADLDLYIWEPGIEPVQNGQLRLDLAMKSSTGSLPQETISFKPTEKGTYKVGILAYDKATYAIDWSGQISS